MGCVKEIIEWTNWSALRRENNLDTKLQIFYKVKPVSAAPAHQLRPAVPYYDAPQRLTKYITILCNMLSVKFSLVYFTFISFFVCTFESTTICCVSWSCFAAALIFLSSAEVGLWPNWTFPLIQFPTENKMCLFTSFYVMLYQRQRRQHFIVVWLAVGRSYHQHHHQHDDYHLMWFTWVNALCFPLSLHHFTTL